MKQDDAGLAEAASGLARLERVLGRNMEARTYYLDASKIYRNRESYRGARQRSRHYGDLDFQLGRKYQAAEERHYREAIERFQGEWDEAGVARAFMSLADLEKRLGLAEEAQGHNRQKPRAYCFKERDSQGLARALQASLGEMQ